MYIYVIHTPSRKWSCQKATQSGFIKKSYCISHPQELYLPWLFSTKLSFFWDTLYHLTQDWMMFLSQNMKKVYILPRSYWTLPRMQWGWQQASLTCGSRSCAWAGLVSAGWTALQCFLDRMWCSPGGKTHRPFQEYRQYCSQHSRKLGQSFYLRCLSCFWPLSFGIWKLRKTVRAVMEHVRTQILRI